SCQIRLMCCPGETAVHRDRDCLDSMPPSSCRAATIPADCCWVCRNLCPAHLAPARGELLSLRCKFRPKTKWCESTFGTAISYLSTVYIAESLVQSGQMFTA